MRNQTVSVKAAADELSTRKARGAFFTPDSIADFLARWAVRSQHSAVLDPTCGEAVFLLAAGRRLKRLGADISGLDSQLFGVDLHRPSLNASMKLLESEDLGGALFQTTSSTSSRPISLVVLCPWSTQSLAIPPFVRYQEHRGEDRRLLSASGPSSRGTAVGAGELMGGGSCSCVRVLAARGTTGDGATSRTSDSPRRRTGTTMAA